MPGLQGADDGEEVLPRLRAQARRIGRGVLRGVRRQDDARRAFDEVRYESEVGPVDGETASVTFTDYLMKAGGRWHRHRCRQEFTVDASGRITHIVHREIPGEREALDAYFAECGVER